MGGDKGKGMTYQGSGVNYGAMDPFKKACQIAARETARNLEPFGYKEVEWSRGESVYLMEGPDHYISHVEEGLGTQNIVADVMYELTGETYYESSAISTLAMILNDKITLGALPMSAAMHLAVGESSWFDNKERYQALIRGWQKGCNMAGCVWSGGETPTLKGIVMPGTALLSGSAVGIIQPKERIIRCDLQEGDGIILLGSSGMHANGYTLARGLADRLTEEGKLASKLWHLALNGYQAYLSDGRTFGESLLDPTIIYVKVIKDLLDEGVPIHYTANITGHGWRKLMRAPEPFVYKIHSIPEPQPVFQFIQEYGPVDDKEAYGNLNMGAGFALFVPDTQIMRTLDIIQRHNIPAMFAGTVSKKGDQKKVIIKPKDLVFEAESLDIR